MAFSVVQEPFFFFFYKHIYLEAADLFGGSV